MKSIYISLGALIISLISLVRQFYVEWKNNKAKLKILLSIGYHASKNERTPFFNVTIINEGSRDIYIDRPFLCIGSNNKYYKRFDNSPPIEYLYKLEAWSSINIGIAYLIPDSDGQFHMEKDDAIEVNDKVLIFSEGSKFIGHTELDKTKKESKKPKEVFAHIEIMDSNKKKFKSKKIAVTTLNKQLVEFDSIINNKN